MQGQSCNFKGNVPSFGRNLIESIMMGLHPGLDQITFEWQPGPIKMAAALMDYSSLCLTGLGLPADATDQSVFKKRCKEGLHVWGFRI